MPASASAMGLRWELPSAAREAHLAAMNDTQGITPLLVIRGAARAIDFYVAALGAREIVRFEHGVERWIGHADLVVGETSFSITEELPCWGSDAPPSLGGTPVVLQLAVADTEHVVASMQRAGAEVLIPPTELLGERMARVRDPFGHLWIVRQRRVELPVEELQLQRDALVAQAQAAGSTQGAARSEKELTSSARVGSSVPAGRGAIHLVVGPVGAGKSTFATRLAADLGGVRLTLDDWMTRLFARDRPERDVVPWYVERAQRCVDVIGSLAADVAAQGGVAILEIGLLRREQRDRFHAALASAGHAAVVHVLDAPREVRRARVERRNRERGETFSMIVPPEVFELASDLWEPLGDDEPAHRDATTDGTP
jgi:uncharacterized glyoxalase superfamily protein PhnB/predicted kinase